MHESTAQDRKVFTAGLDADVLAHNCPNFGTTRRQRIVTLSGNMMSGAGLCIDYHLAN